MIVNISIKDAKVLSAEYSQQSFIFGSRDLEKCGEMAYRFYALASNRVADLRKRYTSSGILPDISPSEYHLETRFKPGILLRQSEFDDSLRAVASDLSEEVESDARLIGELKYENYMDQYFKGRFSPWYERFYMLRALRQAAEFRNG